MITPDFYVIGFMKCGTTTLHHLLNQHPKIEMAKSKEFHVFTHNKPIESYSTQYAKSGVALRGNTPQNYGKTHIYPNVPREMHATLGERKLIFIVRNPKERLISHWREAIFHGLITQHNWKNVPEEKRRQMVLTGQYSIHIKEYLKYFSPGNIYILSLEELEQDSSGTMEDLLHFLCLKSEISVKQAHKSNTKQEKKILPTSVRWLLLKVAGKKVLGRVERAFRGNVALKFFVNTIGQSQTELAHKQIAKTLEQEKSEMLNLSARGIRTSASLNQTIQLWD